MKNKKIFYILGLGLLLIVSLIIILVINKSNNQKTDNDNKADNNNSPLINAILKNKNKKENDYKKFIDGEVLNENTNFIEYAFISNNKVYIFDPKKLEEGVKSYKLVYDIPSDKKIVNIGIPYGADIYFYTDDDHEYVVKDTNIDNDVVADYSMFEKAQYELKSYNDGSYTEKRYKKKINYDFICNLFYVYDNILYKVTDEYYHYTEKRMVPLSIDKISGNYEGEKILRIYNDRIVRTDKGFYEVLGYKDNGEKKYTTMKIDLLSKYYDEVLTFTYKYVILKDYTLIPINDVMTNRGKDYGYNFYLDDLDRELDNFIE